MKKKKPISKSALRSGAVRVSIKKPKKKK